MKGRWAREWIYVGWNPSPWTATFLDMVEGFACLFDPEGRVDGGTSGSNRSD